LIKLYLVVLVSSCTAVCLCCTSTVFAVNKSCPISADRSSANDGPLTLAYKRAPGSTATKTTSQTNFSRHCLQIICTILPMYAWPISGSLPADKEVKFVTWTTSWRPTGAGQYWFRLTLMNSRNGFPIDDSTVLVIIILFAH